MHIELDIHWVWLTLLSVLFLFSTITNIWNLRLSIRMSKRKLAEIGDTVAHGYGPGTIVGKPSFPFNKEPDQ